ncbi:MAG: DeoR/GlpR family DNA-binding transcription regulator [Cyclobacteriaceae bacterium]|nr:DeoR/GlpR transcriptional regulator [Cyclobacteriaceae bacterium]MCH8517082.1 DeoR/GlpR family DNA-binding transcription regulator [Cyclobacteriaceae bacterium]
MTIAERHRYIVEEVKKHGHVTVSKLSSDLGVSVVTIRKDLKQLEDKNLLYRVHGSATSTVPFVSDRSIDEKQLVNIEEKMKIARHAVRFIEEDDAIIIGSGSTMLAFAKAIPIEKKITVLTAAMNVTKTLDSHPKVEVIQLGGIVRRSSHSVVGNYAESMLQDFACNTLFLSADGICASHGLSTSHLMEAHLNLEMMKKAQKTIVLADSTKFGKKSFGRICSLEDIDMMITDSRISKQNVEEIEALGIDLMVV